MVKCRKDTAVSWSLRSTASRKRRDSRPHEQNAVRRVHHSVGERNAKPEFIPSPTRQALLAQITQRRQLVEMRKQGVTRLQQTTDCASRSDIKSLILLLERLIEKVETRIAALAGLAPIAPDSGQRNGRRVIGGGRATVRTALYLAALHAARHSMMFRAFQQKLQEAGKPVKPL
jgi:transposase